MSLLSRAEKILYERAEEKERKNGPIHEGLEITAKIASAWTGKQLTAEDCYAVLIALKMSRDHYEQNDDHILDLIVYAVARNDLKKKRRTKK